MTEYQKPKGRTYKYSGYSFRFTVVDQPRPTGLARVSWRPVGWNVNLKITDLNTGEVLQKLDYTGEIRWTEDNRYWFSFSSSAPGLENRIKWKHRNTYKTNRWTSSQAAFEAMFLHFLDTLEVLG